VSDGATPPAKTIAAKTIAAKTIAAKTLPAKTPPAKTPPAKAIAEMPNDPQTNDAITIGPRANAAITIVR
jgi:hypothetical protein